MLLGIDAGGTFTDFVFVEIGRSVTIEVHKTLSTPDAPERAIMQGIIALGLESKLQDRNLQIIHGSTVATNLVLEGKQARTVFVSNYGFGDMLQLARQTRPELYALDFPPIAPPVVAELCLETGGRIGADGSVVEPLLESEIDELVAKIQILKPQAVAINLLFSFLDDSFERAIETAIHRAALPVCVSRSSQVLPEYREYERGIATWLNASLSPAVSGYLQRLQAELGNNSLQLMQSSGETLGATQAADSAVNLLLSGPAGGLTAISYLGEQLGVGKIISFDMGGTSTDVALLDGDIGTTNEAFINRYPIAVSMVDMHTIGAGGGSIAFVDSGGMLQVGPQSAGADPGPACYDQGGTEATVTDANLVLGRLQADVALAGSLQLNSELASAAVQRIAEKIGLSIEQTALGIVSIANEHMAKAIRLISVNRGHDPQDFVLASFGGAGGLHVCALADAMQMRKAIVPIHGGVLSALGMVVAHRGRHFSKTFEIEISRINETQLNAEFATLEQHGIAQLSQEGLEPSAMTIKRSADMRYRGQSYTLNIAWESSTEALDAFRQLHSKRYGYSHNTGIELVNIRVNVSVPNKRFDLPAVDSQSTCNNFHRRRVYGHEVEAIIAARADMNVGQKINGPAIITEYSATTFVESFWTVELDPLGNLLLEKQL